MPQAAFVSFASVHNVNYICNLPVETARVRGSGINLKTLQRCGQLGGQERTSQNTYTHFLFHNFLLFCVIFG